jgi:hypothetical protein
VDLVIDTIRRLSNPDLIISENKEGLMKVGQPLQVPIMPSTVSRVTCFKKLKVLDLWYNLQLQCKTKRSQMLLSLHL